MATRLTVRLEADLSITRSGPASSCADANDPGSGYHGELESDTRSAEQEMGQRLLEVNSPAAFVVLTPAASTIRGTLLWVRVREGGPLDVRVTHETAGQITYPVKGLLVLEPADDERVTALAVQGEGTIEWALTGDNA